MADVALTGVVVVVVVVVVFVVVVVVVGVTHLWIHQRNNFLKGI